MTLDAGHRAALDRLRAALDALSEGRLTVAGFSAACRTEDALLEALPPAYRRVRDDLLQRLESGSLFDEESCSFSQVDLREAFDGWLQKAAGRLAG